jgi:capsular polysaccharide export protein
MAFGTAGAAAEEQGLMDQAGHRDFLFLQGLHGPFFSLLGAALLGNGHRVHRVNFNGGDRLYWRLPGAVNYRGRMGRWPEFLERLILARGITDIVLFGDCRPLHRAAIAVAAGLQIQVHVFEEGYIRPDFVTLEIGGVNGHSPLPRDPAWYREQARTLPPYGPEQSVPTSFRRRAMQDVLYNFAQMLLAWQYPFYRSHRPLHPLVEYGGWLWRFANQEAAQRRSEAVLRRLGADPRRYFVFPLQLDSDYQIRLHSPYNGMQPAIEQVLRSFAAHAPDDTILVVKDHPLDNGLINWRRLVATVAASCGIGPRVLHLEVGDVGPLVRAAAGMVTVNSTTGTLALACGVPVITLGDAVYNIPDVTFQGELDMFWRAPTPPDPATYDAFRRVLLARCLVRGGYFSEVGLDMLVRGSLTRLEQAASVHAVQRAPVSRLPAPAVLAAARG